MTVCVALHTYRDEHGEYRMALRGDRVELDDAELKRAIELGAVVEGAVEPLPGPVAEPVLPGADVEDLDEALPDRDAPKAVWVEAAVNAGIDRADAEKATKATLIEMLGA